MHKLSERLFGWSMKSWSYFLIPYKEPFGLAIRFLSLQQLVVQSLLSGCSIQSHRPGEQARQPVSQHCKGAEAEPESEAHPFFK